MPVLLFSSFDVVTRVYVRINFLRNGSKIRPRWFRVGRVEQRSFAANYMRQQQQRCAREKREKKSLSRPAADDFRHYRPLFKFIAHSYPFYSTERIRSPRQLAWLQFTLLYTSHGDNIGRIADVELISVRVNNVAQARKVYFSDRT